jgi:hypothetical protein
MVVGRLVTDAEFRETFRNDPHRALGRLLERGVHLTYVEIAALIATDSTLWDSVAEEMDRALRQPTEEADLTPLVPAK